ncbi:FKBP-type peptidylprolyl isomerase [Methanocaldococcus villosus KIN24-T80]|uniref:Peptidyl-prolyl cis-trans isomerase n=1 Tax=Methanocaldococcus villosus KIN24-T80 TaxID=1069083 RepID=N6VSD0_9EURY|nr:peptidylprolyl isomerase [Methanocaldococcus villosus]ENN96780.1 FKBP-type peptidylprolyl isomerase [Methanocaldococcus villosus KIN24-T80]
MVEKGALIKISYDGYVDGKLFDTTNEELAKKEGIYNPNIVYGPVPIFAGEGMVVKGLDEILLEMDVGEEKEVVLPPEKAFGKRDPAKIKLVPMREFIKRGIKPIVGLRVNIDGEIGRIVKAEGGRVLVDFNHELAGKEVKYRIKIEEKVEGDENIIREIFNMFAPKIKPNVTIEGEKAIIELPEEAFLINLQQIKLAVANEVFKRLKNIKEIKFIETVKRKD